MTKDNSVSTMNNKENGIEHSPNNANEKQQLDETKLEDLELKRKEVLQGKTLKIYWKILTHPQGVVGVREIQKSLKMSSSGSVAYQLNKLISVGIIAKDTESDKYFVKEEIKTGILGFYYRIGYRVVPRYTFYLLFFILGLVCFLFFAISRGDEYLLDPSNWVFLFVLLFGASVFIFESNKIWKMKPD